MPITLRAPAKINLYLRVFPRAADGYHPLRSWFRTIDLADELWLGEGEAMDELDWAEAEDELRLDRIVCLHCSDASLPADSSNLAVRSAEAYASAYPMPVDISLQKNIPIGAGLGGGSADAAAVLAGLNKLFSGSVSYADLNSMAAHLGSDVPFALRAILDPITDAACTGRGEIVQPFAPGRRHVVLLIVPDLEVSTAEVYRRFDELPAPPEDDEPDFAAWSHLPALELLPKLRNDLEPASFSLRPELAALREQAQALVGRPVRMTGSGSALFCLYDERAEAAEALERLAGLNVRRLLA